MAGSAAAKPSTATAPRPGTPAENPACPGPLLPIITSPVNPPHPRPPAERFAILTEGVAKALAAEGLRLGLVAPWLALVWCKLRSTGARILRIAAALEAGTLRLTPPRPLPPLPPLAPRTEDASPRPDHAKARRKEIPTGFGWLLRRVTALSFGRSQLEYLLAEPDMAELIQAAPQVAHHLRPVCRMLGVKPPPGLFPARRPPRRTRPPAAPTPAPEIAKEKPAEATGKPDGPFPRFVPRKRKSRRRRFRLFPLPAGTGPPWPG